MWAKAQVEYCLKLFFTVRILSGWQSWRAEFKVATSTQICLKTLLLTSVASLTLISSVFAQTPVPPVAGAQPAPAAPLLEDVVVARETPKSPKGDKKEIIEGADEKRVLLEPKESVKLRIKSKKKTGKIKFLAPNGGTFNRRRGPLKIDAAKLDGDTEIEFTAGPSRGRYTVEMSSGAETEILEFWVGEEAPRGRPGPDLEFKAPQ